jgi:hypothetical protein
VTSVEDTRKQIEETRAELDATLGRFEARVHDELDWKARLRRNKAAILVGGAGLVAVAAAGIATARVIGSRRHRGIEEQLKTQLGALTHLDDVKREVLRLREHLAAVAAAQDREPLWQKIALRATTALSAAAGHVITASVLDRFADDEPRDVA